MYPAPPRSRSVLILLPWGHPLIQKKAKWPLDLPLTFPVIVSSDDMLSQQKPKLILTLS